MAAKRKGHRRVRKASHTSKKNTPQAKRFGQAAKTCDKKVAAQLRSGSKGGVFKLIGKCMHIEAHK